ncbi:MAG: HVO_A0114 family putative DNA-binding protein [Betaproteobacteria bacterium]
MKVGIMPYREMKARTLAIARGRYKPRPDEPKVWFNSLRSLASVLSEENQALLQAIREHNPESIAELEQITGRAASNLTRTLHTLERYGLVELKPAACAAKAGGRAPLKPVVLADGVDFELSF